MILAILQIYLSAATTLSKAEVKPTNFKVGVVTIYTFSATINVANQSGKFIIQFPT
jgi:hypothetical protein